MPRHLAFGVVLIFLPGLTQATTCWITPVADPERVMTSCHVEPRVMYRRLERAT